MRTMLALPVALGVVAALAACGPVDQVAGGPLAASPATLDTSTPDPTASAGGRGVPPTTPTTILSEQDTRGLESTPWAVVDEHDRTLVIQYVAGGGCSAWKGVRVQETAHSVEIWTTVRTDDGDQACTSELDLGASSITLSQPLGTRKLLHAPVSTDWQRYVDEF